MSIQIVAPGKAATSSERAEEVIVEEENEDGHVTKDAPGGAGHLRQGILLVIPAVQHTTGGHVG